MPTLYRELQPPTGEMNTLHINLPTIKVSRKAKKQFYIYELSSDMRTFIANYINYSIMSPTDGRGHLEIIPYYLRYNKLFEFYEKRYDKLGIRLYYNYVNYFGQQYKDINTIPRSSAPTETNKFGSLIYDTWFRNNPACFGIYLPTKEENLKFAIEYTKDVKPSFSQRMLGYVINHYINFRIYTISGYDIETKKDIITTKDFRFKIDFVD